MPFTLPDLPFDRQALGDHMSVETLDYHHGKHHRAYVEKTEALAGKAGVSGGTLVELIRRAGKDGDKALFNNAGQFWNHNFFWQCLSPPDGQRPVGQLAEMIEEEWGGTDPFLEAFKDEAVGHFASGWAWLVLDGDRLAITSLHDGDTPAAHEGMKPLLTLDLWEHAYYIDYRNDRPGFVDSVLANLINWEFVAANLDGSGLARADQQR